MRHSPPLRLIYSDVNLFKNAQFLHLAFFSNLPNSLILTSSRPVGILFEKKIHTHPETHLGARPAAHIFSPPPCKTETSPYLCTRFRKRKRAATAGEKKTPRDSCGSRKNLLTSQLGFRPAKTGKTKTKPKHIDILEVTHTTSRRCGGDAARRARVQKRGPAAAPRQALKEKQKTSHTTKSLILAQDER